LLGEWLGARTWLEDHGITPGVTFVTGALGNPVGGLQHGFTATNNLGVDLRFGFQKMFGMPGSSLDFSFSERFGSSLIHYIGNVFSVQQIFPGTYKLVDLAYRQRLLDERIEL